MMGRVEIDDILSYKLDGEYILRNLEWDDLLVMKDVTLVEDACDCLLAAVPCPCCGRVMSRHRGMQRNLFGQEYVEHWLYCRQCDLRKGLPDDLDKIPADRRVVELLRCMGRFLTPTRLYYAVIGVRREFRGHGMLEYRIDILGDEPGTSYRPKDYGERISGMVMRDGRPIEMVSSDRYAGRGAADDEHDGEDVPGEMGETSKGAGEAGQGDRCDADRNGCDDAVPDSAMVHCPFILTDDTPEDAFGEFLSDDVEWDRLWKQTTIGSAHSAVDCILATVPCPKCGRVMSIRDTLVVVSGNTYRDYRLHCNGCEHEVPLPRDMTLIGDTSLLYDCLWGAVGTLLRPTKLRYRKYWGNDRVIWRIVDPDNPQLDIDPYRFTKDVPWRDDE